MLRTCSSHTLRRPELATQPLCLALLRSERQWKDFISMSARDIMRIPACDSDRCVTHLDVWLVSKVEDITAEQRRRLDKYITLFNHGMSLSWTHRPGTDHPRNCQAFGPEYPPMSFTSASLASHWCALSELQRASHRHTYIA